MSDTSARFVGSIPETYDRGLGPVLFADFAADMAARVAALAPARVLEIAAGTGILTRTLRDRLPPSSGLTATDLNAPMLELARAKFAPGEAVAFQTADACALPFPDAAFDAVACQFGIMFLPDRDLAYREMRRVLVPGGHVALSVWDAPRHNPFGQIADALMTRLFPADPPPFYRFPYNCAAIDPIKQALGAAGFTGLSVHVLSRVHAVDAHEFAHSMVFGNPLVDQLRARGGDPAAVVAAMAREFEAALGAAPTRLPMQTITYLARSATDRSD